MDKKIIGIVAGIGIIMIILAIMKITTGCFIPAMEQKLSIITGPSEPDFALEGTTLSFTGTCTFECYESIKTIPDYKNNVVGHMLLYKPDGTLSPYSTHLKEFGILDITFKKYLSWKIFNAKLEPYGKWKAVFEVYNKNTDELLWHEEREFYVQAYMIGCPFQCCVAEEKYFALFCPMKENRFGECINHQCIYKSNEPSPQPPSIECPEGETIREVCSDGSKITTAECIEGQWRYIVISCPESGISTTRCVL